MTINASIDALEAGTAEYAGAGVFFKSADCLDVSSYTGVRFTVAGEFGECSVTFKVSPSEDSAPTANPGRGECSAAVCIQPSYPITTLGTLQVPFSALQNGNPLALVDTSAIINFFWEFVPPVGATNTNDASPASETCNASITVSNMSLY